VTTDLSPDLAPTIHHTFAPVGECIYCGSKDKLTNEHIIAYSLNGTEVLPLASCRKCAAITSQLERIFARGPAWPMRAAFGFKSYRKKKYPTSLPLVMVIGGKRQNINVPLAQFPIISPLAALRGFTILPLRPFPLQAKIIVASKV
jgi:hypothetical protein